VGDLSGLRFLLQPVVPAYLSLLIVAVMAWRIYPHVLARILEGRRDKESAKDGDWRRLRGEIDRLDHRCAQIEEREQECQHQLTDALHRIGELEGYNLGIGDARQTAQRMLSEGRESDAAKRKAEE
jgi:hypothetical protein